MKRVFNQDEPELMDRPQPASAELERDLVNLASLNRYFGSHRLVRRFLAAWLQPDRTYRVLDVCTGFGDIPRMMVDWGRRRGVRLRIDAIDANAATIEIARAHSADYREIEFQRADMLKYDSRETYDLVCCSLALHHFSETDAVRVLRHCRELSHRFVLVADLVREFTTTIGVWALTQFVYREPMTRHDGRLSAQRAFSFTEMRLLAEAAEWKDFGHARFPLCRQALWLDSRNFAEIPAPAVATNVALPSPA